MFGKLIKIVYLCIMEKLDLATLKWVLEQSSQAGVNKFDLRQIIYDEIEKIENVEDPI